MATDSKAKRTPYDANHVAIVDEGHTITALYIPDPELAKDPRRIVKDIANRQYANVELVATARRFYKKDGASFSGWIVDSGPYSYSDPIANKREAIASLRHHIREYFQH
ncbi:hypothetical protein [Streptomyces hirsutus]|uniref:hypothetical protein n=1 Tax=Streptomyces hirsutus TaxID=35620 RepID=UPI0036A8ACC7